jgi:hypothetical protein
VFVRFSADPNAPYPTPLFYDFPDLKDQFSFVDSGGASYTLPFSENIVQPQWGNEYYYSGGGFALTFACPTNQSVSSDCQQQPSNGHVTCNCSQRFDHLISPSPGDDDSSTFIDGDTRALGTLPP